MNKFITIFSTKNTSSIYRFAELPTFPRERFVKVGLYGQNLGHESAVEVAIGGNGQAEAAEGAAVVPLDRDVAHIDCRRLLVRAEGVFKRCED